MTSPPLHPSELNGCGTHVGRGVLEALRNPEASAPPPPGLLRNDPLPCSNQSRSGLITTQDLTGRWLAIDLDDTLLMGSWTLGPSWGSMGNAIASLRYERLRTDWIASAKRLLRGKLQRVHCRKRHPFLNHPVVEVAFRPGMLNGLAELKMAGLGLVLVTASARQRVEYLATRFPPLADLFGGERGRMVAAEDLVEAVLAAEADPEAIDHAPSARAHLLRPRSIAVKTPWAISRAAGIPPYDLLIDDSVITANVFAKAGLGDRLLFIEGRHPWSGYGQVILNAALGRLLNPGLPSADMVPLICPDEAIRLPEGLLPQKTEDPFYYPLLHYRDQF